MKNIAIIFAGGTGKRMKLSEKPKQFLECNKKPILIYTLEKFNSNKLIDNIILVVLSDWIDYSKELIKKYNITKVSKIVAGGKNGQESIYNGIAKAYELYGENSIVLIHDGVRPLIDDETITKNIECVNKYGSAITVSNAIETILINSCKDNKIKEIVDRSHCKYARAPQSFILKDIYDAHILAIRDNKTNFIDSASLMDNYGYPLYEIEGNIENIKITTPNDYYMFCSLVKKEVNK